jgi:hypothetical protein
MELLITLPLSFKNFLYTLTGRLAEIYNLLFVNHPLHQLRRRALEETALYIESRFHEAFPFYGRSEMLRYAVSETKTSGIYAEFGVFKGESLRIIASRTENTVHGFDSFSGLPAPWVSEGLKKGCFSLGGVPPKLPKNALLHIGLFEDTLPVFCEEYLDKLAFAHIDCDLYKSTVTVLHHLAKRLQVGSVIVFDEYFNHPFWQQQEYKAWQECVKTYSIQYEYLAYSRQGVVVRVTAI